MTLNKGLIGHWDLTADARDSSGRDHHGVARSVVFGTPGPPQTAGSAQFDGRESVIEIPHASGLALADGPFSVAAWVYTDAVVDDVLGDVLSKHAPADARGLNLSLISHAGMTSSQSNYRNLHFGIDAGDTPVWVDRGRPGNAVLIFALAVHDGELFAGTFETGAEETGHVYRYAGGSDWEDCGSPDGSNSVMSLASHGGALYAGTGCYDAKGSALEPSPNETPGGRVYRYLGDRNWQDCGQLGEARTTFALTEYRGELHAMPLYLPGIYRYGGRQSWEFCGVPGEQRSMSLGVYNGELLSAGNGRAGVWAYEGGESWRDCGRQEGVSQTYSFAIYRGELYVGTWPDGKVFRYDGGTTWHDCGRLGEEREVMALAIYNGKLYGGTLPLGQVYRYDGDEKWTLTGQLDTTPDVTYRRVWTSAVYDGQLFAGTLPSGRAHSMRAGACATHDHAFPPGWHHIAAVRNADQLQLYIDGETVADSGNAELDISTEAPLLLGFGQHDHFLGRMADVRLYRRALTDREIGRLSAR